MEQWRSSVASAASTHAPRPLAIVRPARMEKCEHGGPQIPSRAMLESAPMPAPTFMSISAAVRSSGAAVRSAAARPRRIMTTMTSRSPSVGSARNTIAHTIRRRRRHEKTPGPRRPRGSSSLEDMVRSMPSSGFARPPRPELPVGLVPGDRRGQARSPSRPERLRTIGDGIRDREPKCPVLVRDAAVLSLKSIREAD